MSNNLNTNIYQMFPTPLYVSKYKGDMTEINNYLHSIELKEHNPGYGMISKDSYIIDNPICKPLAEFIHKSMTDFAVNCMALNEQIFFSQSWISGKAQGASHKAHSHPNTIIASVFYFDAEEGDSPICFSKEARSLNRSYIEPTLRDDYQQNIFAQDEIYYHPKKNDLIIFPSWLMHGVPPNQKPKIRKVLGVNAMTKGKLGDQETISELDYKRYV